MPKAPILNREAFYDRLSDGTFRDLDWNLVNTSLGAMVEPRQVVLVDGGKVAQRDLKDASFNSRREFDEDKLFSLMGTAGHQLPVDYNT